MELPGITSVPSAVGEKSADYADYADFFSYQKMGPVPDFFVVIIVAIFLAFFRSGHYCNYKT